jgi:hypothetical protein
MLLCETGDGLLKHLLGRVYSGNLRLEPPWVERKSAAPRDFENGTTNVTAESASKSCDQAIRQAFKYIS